MENRYIEDILGELVGSGKISKANYVNAKNVASNLPKNTIIHFFGDTYYVITDNLILYSRRGYDLDRVPTTRTNLEDACLFALLNYGLEDIKKLAN